MACLPIAVLDTGAGGLSVVKALSKLLPDEEIHYFADTAHLPYGIKSPELIKHLAIKMAKRLVALSRCKVLVVACHTISVWCLKDIEVAVSVPVIGMMNPSILGLKQMLQTNPINSVGIISTKATVNSRVYHDAWPHIDPEQKTRLIEHACGPLVSLVEEADLSDQDLGIILDHFLPAAIKSADALLIGCTHFQALISVLKKVLKPGAIIVDAADFAAETVVETLEKSGQLLPFGHKKSRLTIYVTDNPERFKVIARRFIEGELLIEWLRDYAKL